MNNPSPKTDKEVFEPVSIEQGLPEKQGCYFVGWDKGTNQGFVSIDIALWNPDKKVFEFSEEDTSVRQPTHWLKKVYQTDKDKTAEGIEKMAKEAIKDHPFPDMEYPASAVTLIKRDTWIDGYKAAQTDKEALKFRIAELERQGTFTRRDMIDLIEWCAFNQLMGDPHEEIYNCRYGTVSIPEQILTQFINQKANKNE